MTPPLTLNIMTAALSPGDAIGNYILTSARLWREWGVHVNIYADAIHPAYQRLALPSKLYWPTGKAILWAHYSIYSQNIALMQSSTDWKVMDFHGISPPYLFAGQNEHLQALCQQGWDTLPTLAATFNACVVHSDYSRQVLIEQGFAAHSIYKLPLCVDTFRFEGQAVPTLASQLARLDYLLLVGRIVPQKDVLAALDILAAIREQRPSTHLILVGSRDQAPAYQQQLDRAIMEKGLTGRVLFTGHVNETAVLATLFQHAKFLLVTSEWESFCVPIVEAMHFGLPAIVHNVAPLPEVAGSAGLVIDKHDVAETAVTILNLWQNEAAYQQQATAAQQRALAFSDQALAQALLNMMKEVAQSVQPQIL